MKTTRILILISAALLITSIAYARRFAWVATDKPPVSLEEAVSIAQTELNKGEQKKDWYCIAASLAQTFSAGDWSFVFATKDGSQMWVNVASDKSVKKSVDGFKY